MLCDNQQNTGRVQEERSFASLDRSYINHIHVNDVLVLFMFSVMAYWTSISSELCYR